MRSALLLGTLAVLVAAGPVAAQPALVWTTTYPGPEPGLYTGLYGRGDDPPQDFDGDGIPDVTTDVWFDTPGIYFRHAGLVFSGATGALLARVDSVTHLTPTPDLTGDGVPDLWVLIDEDNGGPAGGRYELVSGQAVMDGEPNATVVVVRRPGPAPYSSSADVLAAGLDATGDGVPDLVGMHSGRVWLYSGAALAAGQTAPVRSFAPPDAEALFSPSRNSQLALVPDLDGDGVADLLVSDPVYEPPGAPNIGVVYAFSGATGALIHRLSIPSALISLGDLGLATIGGPPGSGPGAGPDLDGDGVPEIVVASIYSAPSAEGVIHIFSGATGALLRTHLMPEPHPNSNFGTNLRVVPDADGDGVADLLAVAWLNPSEDEFGPPVVLVIGSDTGAELWRVLDPEESTSSGFGLGYVASAVGGDERTRLFVSAPFADVAGQVDAGAVYAFALLPVAGESAPPSATLGVSVWPTPARSSATLALSLAEASSVRVWVVDALGRVVRRVEAGALAAGEHRLALDARGLPAGVYVVRVTTGEGVASARLVVTR